MFDNDLHVACAKCGKKQKVSQMRYNRVIDGVLCEECFAKTPQTKSKLTVKKNTIGYRCTNCNYKFTRIKGSSPILRCPYCASDNVLEEKETEAERLLREVSEDPLFNR